MKKKKKILCLWLLILIISLLFLFFLDIDNLIADEFSAELVEGVAFVAGHDEESRPVLVNPIFSQSFSSKMHESECSN